MFPLKPRYFPKPRTCFPSLPALFPHLPLKCTEECILSSWASWPFFTGWPCSEREAVPARPVSPVTFPRGVCALRIPEFFPTVLHDRCVWADRDRLGFHRWGCKVNSAHPQLRVAMKLQLGLQRISFCLESGQSWSRARLRTRFWQIQFSL